MCSGYHQVQMRTADEHKTAFRTHHSPWPLPVQGHAFMPFGLCNVPATFQCLMNSIQAPFLCKFVLVFLDDILMYNPTLEDHLSQLRQVFSTLRQHQFYLKQSKCAIAQPKLQYLGYILSEHGVSTDPSKIEAMLQQPSPTTITELRGFLVLTRYCYRRFVQHYGILAKTLTNPLKKKQFLWDDSAQQAFTTLKAAMCSTPVLALPNFKEQFGLETDACDTSIRAVLIQNNRPIAYLSKPLSSSHQHYSTYEK